MPPSSVQARAAEPSPSSQSEASTDSTPTPDRIRRAALELFAARGYAGASMADIAARVGVRKASLYNYYDSKEALLLELLGESLSAWKCACRPVLEGEGSCEERLHRHLEAAVAFADESAECVAVMRLAASLVWGELGERVRALLVEHNDEYLRTLAEFLAGARAAGELAAGDDDPRALAAAWKAALDGLLTNQILRQGADSPYRAHLDTIWAVLWRGLGGGESTLRGDGATA